MIMVHADDSVPLDYLLGKQYSGYYQAINASRDLKVRLLPSDVYARRCISSIILLLLFCCTAAMYVCCIVRKAVHIHANGRRVLRRYNPKPIIIVAKPNIQLITYYYYYYYSEL